MTMLLAPAAPRAGRRVAAALAAATVGLGTIAALSLSALTTTGASATTMTGVSCPVAGVPIGKGDGSTQLDTEQIKMAQVIIGVGKQLQVPTRGLVVAITAALQESGLRNLPYGDLDSLGLFQMRPSQGWGTREQILTPEYSARKFFSVLYSDVPNWQSMSINNAAQAVERSGFPDAYAKHEQHAVQIVSSIGGGTDGQVDVTGCTAVTTAATGATATALQVMMQQVGKPYVWGATGPDSFDCSGLIVYGWRQAGYQLTVRTSQEMYTIATPVPSGQEQPGDLIFTEMQADGPAHVLIVVTPGTAVEAPNSRIPVRIRQYDAQREGARFGRLPSSALKAST
ncbi:NlpC/P60 family protein [Streptomyces sp. NPDC037389]|uniref:C40 family peptidase n=1 Tax=Streptomyces sp. NPDC037389 TaxID=3155369 RepID=UPI0033DC8C26